MIDLKQPAAPQVFTLAPVAAYQHRLVFDLLSDASEPDPLVALIARRGCRPSSRPRQRRVGDALGDFIGAHDRRSRPQRAGAEPRRRAPAAARRRPPRARRKIDRLIIVALDPGHGGEDPGAIGPSGTREKDVVLQIALRLRDRINATSRNMRAHADARRRLLRAAARARAEGAARAGRPVRLASTPTPSSRPRRAAPACSR